MPWREALVPERMERVALVGPLVVLRDALVRVAGAGVVELDDVPAPDGAAQGEAARRLQGMQRVAGAAAPVLSAAAPDLDRWEQDGRADLVAGEAKLEERARGAVARGGVGALAGWAPASALPGLAASLEEAGGAVVPLPRPRGVDAPTLLHAAGLRGSLTPLVETYGTVPYPDIDPTVPAAVAYVLMFGMMFGDVGHGLLLLLLAAAALRAGWPRRLAHLRRAWPFLAGAGLTSSAFGLLYGEFFGPTGLVPVLWLEPLAQPIPLLLAALGVGAVLLAGAYLLGTVNRLREGGLPVALYAPSGVAGAALFLGLGLAATGAYLNLAGPVAVGAAVGAAGLGLAAVGFFSEAGGGGAGVAQAAVGLFDLVIRLGSNLVSFARLAAFGLAHAALGVLVWDGTTALWRRGGLLVALAVLLAVAGNALAFALEALVAGIQALRLEYYELFSRVFLRQGRPFRPWRLPVASEEGLPCRSG